MIKLWFLVLAGWVAAVDAAMAAGADSRFSRTITTAERTATGIELLSSDQVAILDALVRRDVAVMAQIEPAARESTTFSQRLTADERKNAGLADLSSEQRQQLDAAVARLQIAGPSTHSLMTPPIFLSSRHASAARTVDKKKEREIHGSMTLSYGWGEDGYSSKTGAMVMNMTDPDRRYSVTIGYSETHVKGGPSSGVVYPGSYPGGGPRYPGDLQYLRP